MHEKENIQKSDKITPLKSENQKIIFRFEEGTVFAVDMLRRGLDRTVIKNE